MNIDLNEKLNNSIQNSFTSKLRQDLIEFANIKRCRLNTDGFRIGDSEASLQIDVWHTDENVYKFRNSSLTRELCYDTFDKAYKAIIDSIINFKENSDSLIFFTPINPKNAVEYSNIEKSENIVARYMIDYEVSTDFMSERWTILIGKTSLKINMEIGVKSEL